MTTKMVVDYGRSSTKAVSETGKEIIYPSWYATSVVDPNDSFNIGLSDRDIKDYLKVNINGQEFNVGKLAKNSAYCFDGSSNTDILPDDFDTEELTKAEVNILTAIALLSNEDSEAIDLMTTLPGNQFNDTCKKIFKDRLENINFKIKIYDYNADEYKAKNIYINSLDVRKQGLCAFMHHLLTKSGHINKNRNQLINETLLIFDVGRYSTDILAVDNMEEINLDSDDVRVKGMEYAFEKIRKDVFAKYKVNIKRNEAEKYVKQGYVSIRGNQEDITDIINPAYAEFCKQISNNAKDRLPIEIERIDTILIAGGGANAITEQLKSELKRDITIINEPRMANALGGIKIMKLNENTQEDSQE